jgi:hypothetical protein
MPDFGFRNPGILTLLAHRFLKQLLNANLLKLASFDVPSSPQANSPCRPAGKRTIHEDLLRKQTIFGPRLKTSRYKAESQSG